MVDAPAGSAPALSPIAALFHRRRFAGPRRAPERRATPEDSPRPHPMRIYLQMLNTPARSEEHTSELQSLMRTSYAVFCLKKKKKQNITTTKHSHTHTNK